MGIPFRDLIYDVCGGIPNGRQLKGVIPGGSSMPPLDACELDVPMRVRRAHDRPAHQGRRGRARRPLRPGRRPQAEDHGRLGRHRGVRRQHRHRGALRAHHAVLRPRVVRPVHPLPRGLGLAGARLQAAGARRGRRRATSSCWPTSPTASAATPSARSATRRPGRCWASSPSSAPTSRPSSSRKTIGIPRRRRERRRERRVPDGDLDRRRGRLLDPGGDRRRSSRVFTITRKNPVTAVMSLVATFFGLAAHLRDAVGALPGRLPGPGLRRRHHGALHLRGHDPEPRGGRAAVAARPLRVARRAGGRLPVS